MSREPELADVLGRFVERSGYSMGQLGRLSDIPKRTIANWLGGRVRRPRHAADLLKLADVLHLAEGETNELLRAADHPSVPELLATVEDEATRKLLAQTTARGQGRTPFQAIPDLPYFVGREEEVQALEDVLLGGGRALICSLQGMGGVGKTALAAHLAYRLRPHFPDGVLWARVDRAEPLSILSAFASAYGRDVSSYTDVESRSQVVREILADKQALIILDNVQSSDDVKPLLPPSVGRCAVILTTRRQNLAVTSGTHRFTVGPFDRAGEEAIALFGRFLGDARMQKEVDTLAEIAELLGHLPLAVAIAASRMAYEPGWSAAAFLEHLQQERNRLDLLSYDDQSVRLSARVTYDMLQPEEQALFAALGAFRSEHVNVEALSAMTERPPKAVEAVLRRLYALSLVQIGQGERYRLHPLLHDFARERLRLREDEDAVRGRMVTFYAGYVDRRRRNVGALDRELDNLLAAVAAARAQARHHELLAIVTGLQLFLETKGMYDLAAGQLALAEETARSVGDEVGLAGVLLYRARLSRKRGAFAAARTAAAEGLALARARGDRRLTSALLGEVGMVRLRPCRPGETPADFQEGLSLARERNDADLTMSHLLHLGFFHQNDPAKAIPYYEEGLALARQSGDEAKRAIFANNLGAVLLKQGEADRAEAYLRESLRLALDLGYQEVVGTAHVNLGKLARRIGSFAKAREHLEEALAVARRLGQVRLLRSVFEQLGALAATQEAYGEAEAYFREALSVARESEDRLAAGNIALALAQVLSQRGAFAEIEAYFRESLAAAAHVTDFGAQAGLLNEWGELLRRGGHHEAASTAYARALALAQQGGAAQAMKKAKQGLSELD